MSETIGKIRKDLPELPSRMKDLPLDHRGYPVPWFVYIDEQGKADFRVIAPGRIVDAWNQKLCWLCGKKMGTYRAYVIGPMCAINRISSEPPSHRECAEYAARACPFLTQPRMKRNEKGLDTGEYCNAAGFGIKRNPGVALIWITRGGRLVRAANGVLFNVGEPVEVLWFCEGHPATRAEVLESIETGLPFLREFAEKDGQRAMAELSRRTQEAYKLLPRGEDAR